MNLKILVSILSLWLTTTGFGQRGLINPRLIILTADKRIEALSDRVDGKGVKQVFPGMTGIVEALTLNQWGYETEPETLAQRIGPRPFGEYRIDKRFVIDSVVGERETQRVITLFLVSVVEPNRTLKIEIRSGWAMSLSAVDQEVKAMKSDGMDRILIVLSEVRVEKLERFLQPGMAVFIHPTLPDE
ncbi:MAG: hypothetical protein Q8Q05_03105 [bacterium]|nr:hypothetical protein [bacterium]